MEESNGWRDQDNREEWHLNFNMLITRQEGNWCEVGVQDKERYKERSSKIQSEVFAPIAWLKTIGLVLSLVAQHKWKIYQLDMKSSFLKKKFM